MKLEDLNEAKSQKVKMSQFIAAENLTMAYDIYKYLSKAYHGKNTITVNASKNGIYIQVEGTGEQSKQDVAEVEKALDKSYKVKSDDNTVHVSK